MTRTQNAEQDTKQDTEQEEKLIDMSVQKGQPRPGLHHRL